MHAPGVVATRHFLVHDAAAGGHPLHVTGAERSTISEAVAVFDRSGQHIGDGFDSAVRMPGKTSQIIIRPVVAKIVEQKERVEFGRVAESETALQLDACAFHGRSRFDDLFYRTERHVISLRPDADASPAHEPGHSDPEGCVEKRVHR